MAQRCKDLCLNRIWLRLFPFSAFNQRKCCLLFPQHRLAASQSSKTLNSNGSFSEAKRLSSSRAVREEFCCWATCLADVIGALDSPLFICVRLFASVAEGSGAERCSWTDPALLNVGKVAGGREVAVVPFIFLQILIEEEERRSWRCSVALRQKTLRIYGSVFMVCSLVFANIRDRDRKLFSERPRTNQEASDVV